MVRVCSPNELYLCYTGAVQMLKVITENAWIVMLSQTDWHSAFNYCRRASWGGGENHPLGCTLDRYLFGAENVHFSFIRSWIMSTSTPFTTEESTSALFTAKMPASASFAPLEMTALPFYSQQMSAFTQARIRRCGVRTTAAHKSQIK